MPVIKKEHSLLLIEEAKASNLNGHDYYELIIKILEAAPKIARRNKDAELTIKQRVWVGQIEVAMCIAKVLTTANVFYLSWDSVNKWIEIYKPYVTKFINPLYYSLGDYTGDKLCAAPSHASSIKRVGLIPKGAIILDSFDCRKLAIVINESSLSIGSKMLLIDIMHSVIRTPAEVKLSKLSARLIASVGKTASMNSNCPLYEDSEYTEAAPYIARYAVDKYRYYGLDQKGNFVNVNVK